MKMIRHNPLVKAACIALAIKAGFRLEERFGNVLVYTVNFRKG